MDFLLLMLGIIGAIFVIVGTIQMIGFYIYLYRVNINMWAIVTILILGTSLLISTGIYIFKTWPETSDVGKFM